MKYTALVLAPISIFGLLGCDQEPPKPQERIISFDFRAELKNEQYFSDNLQDAYELATKCYREITPKIRNSNDEERDEWNKTTEAKNCRMAAKAWNDRDKSIQYEWYHPMLTNQRLE